MGTPMQTAEDSSLVAAHLNLYVFPRQSAMLLPSQFVLPHYQKERSLQGSSFPFRSNNTFLRGDREEEMNRII